MPRMADPGGPPLSTTVTCSQSWLSGAHTGKYRGREGEGEIERMRQRTETVTAREGGNVAGEREQQTRAGDMEREENQR